MAEKTKGAQKERHRKILEEARTRFRRCSDWEATARTRFRDDVKFAEADAYNQWQWPTNVLADRQKRVNLTINRVRQHNLDILNDARQARIAIKVRPLRGGASFESAQMFDGLIRHIEYISNAASAYQLALKFAVQGGIGWFRLVTDYVGDDTFDQDIFIRQIKDPLTVYLDPDISEFDGSDARYGFVFTDMPKDEFDKAYPQYKDIAADNEIAPDQSWMLGERVRVAEYFRCVQDESKLYAFVDPATGEQVVKTEKEVDKALLDLIIDAPDTAMRSVMLTKVEYFKIVGDNIAEEKEWLGRYIPLIRVVGEETVIDGLLDRKGHTRALLDSQRMLNYNFPLSLDTPLPTPTGWTTMGEVKTGDHLLDEHGKPAKVLGMSPTYLFRDCYRITFDDGSEIIADAEHKWTVEERGKRIAAGQNWSMADRRTDELTPGKHFIYQTAPLELPDVPLPVHPYVLGYWLGNGTTAGGKICCHARDGGEIKRHIEECGYNVSAVRPYTNGSKAVDFTVFGLVTDLRKLGVIGNKHIPSQYLRASKSQREALLQGLMDSDGHISKQGQCSFQNTNVAIVDGIAELLRTLSLKATYAVTSAVMVKFPQGHTSLCAEGRRFAFTAPPEANVFRLERKRCMQKRDRHAHPRRTNRHRIKSVAPVPWVPVRCLTVDTPTHLFLAGEGMVPTHNSASVEFGALQSKVPYVAPARAIENYEEYWNNANTANYSVLPWNHTDEDGNPVPPPQRQQPPTGAPVFMQGARDALEQMYLVSGQNQADFGQPGNEKSGVAIRQRQRQGDNATYHYLDHQAIAVRFCGKQLLDLIPKVYDTDRMVQYRDEAGNETELRIDPNAPEAYSKEEDEQGNEFAVLNPRLGAYDVQADVGPAYATRRQEAFEAFSQLLSSNKELISVVGDIWMRFADIPGAEEAAQRLKRLVPQAALKDGPSPDMVAAQQQIEQLQNFAMGLAQKLADKEADWQNDQQKLAIEGYKAQSGRLTAIKEALALDPKGLLRLVMLALDEAADTSRSIEDVGEAAYIAPPAPEEIAPAMGGQMPPPMVPEAQDEPV